MSTDFSTTTGPGPLTRTFRGVEGRREVSVDSDTGEKSYSNVTKKVRYRYKRASKSHFRETFLGSE